MDQITTPPLHDFLADVTTGQHVIEQLKEALSQGSRILIWGPRVGAIELAEDLFALWPDQRAIMGINFSALWTRTRADGQDSGWVPWVDVEPAKLVEQVEAQKPAGIVLTYLSPGAGTIVPGLLEGPWGFVTSLASTSREQALADAAKICGPSADRFEFLVGVAEVGAATYISQIDRLRAGALENITQLSSGHYVAS